MELLLLALVLFVGLILIPLGLPGTWVILAAAPGYNFLTGTEAVSGVSMLVLLGLAIIGEVIEFTLAARYTRLYGGSRRAGWWAIIGGLIGAIVGVPIPVIGSVIGAFVGSFLGALVAEWTRGTETRAATRVATGAFLGRVFATAAKVGIGLAMAVWILFAAWR